MITVVDYGIGNIASVINMLQRIGFQAKTSKCPNEIAEAEKIILPGVGSFDAGMSNLRAYGLIDALNHFALVKKKPILGICLGAQILGLSSDEGELPGLGWIEMKVKKFEYNKDIKIPHMSWKHVEKSTDHLILEKIDQHSRFYFVHSYYMSPENNSNVLLTAEHGIKFAAGVYKDNIIGLQFHPEKSHKYGMLILKNFAESC
jgi:glutamine amidotransferase